MVEYLIDEELKQLEQELEQQLEQELVRLRCKVSKRLDAGMAEDSEEEDLDEDNSHGL